MKLQDVMLRAMAKRITWYQAAEILGISCRQLQRWHARFEYEGLFDSTEWGAVAKASTDGDGGRSAEVVPVKLISKFSFTQTIQVSFCRL